MREVRRDDLGLWIAHGDSCSYGAIRPGGPSRMRPGDMVDTSHFRDTPLHGVGRADGCGWHREAWISAPCPKEIFDLPKNARRREAAGLDGFQRAQENYLRDLGMLHAANPKHGSGLESKVDVAALRRGWNAFVAARSNWDLRCMRGEFVDQGAALAAKIAAFLDARDLEDAASMPGQGPQGCGASLRI